MEGTFWALVPPIIAIVLALITKEVYSSLFVGILVGSAFVANFNVRRELQCDGHAEYDLFRWYRGAACRLL